MRNPECRQTELTSRHFTAVAGPLGLWADESYATADRGRGILRVVKAGLLVKGAYTIVREVARHILRRPVVGVAAAARTADGRWLLIRRGDSGQWALAGGTLEWGETLETALRRELLEEAGVEQLSVVRLVGVYSKPDRDPRFHAVTVVVEVEVDAPQKQPVNPLEILEVRLFERAELPSELSHDMTLMLQDALAGKSRFE